MSNDPVPAAGETGPRRRSAAPAVGLLYAALAVLAGAFGAHGLGSRLDERQLALWETAARYLMYGGLGLAVLGLLPGRRGTSGWASRALGVGTGLFAGTVALLALGGPGWLGAVTPLGGLLMILGLLLAAWSVWGGRGE